MLTSNDIIFALGLPPQQAVEYLKAKGLALSWNWYDLWQDAHSKVFTVAKVLKLDILQDIKDALDRSLREGLTFEQFKREIKPLLMQKGWWGTMPAADVPGSDGADDGVVMLGSDHRLRTIYRTNTRVAYNVGRWHAWEESKEEYPYGQYIAVLDASTRKTHAMLHNVVLPITSPLWDTIYPPNDFNCRCRVRKITEAQALKIGITDPDSINFKASPGWNYNPGTASYKPRKSGYDPGLRQLL